MTRPRYLPDSDPVFDQWNAVLGEDDKDAEWADLVKNHGRKAQEIALAEPEYANAETAELMAFFTEEKKRRAA